MNLWNSSERDLAKKTGTREKFSQDGVYEVTIKEAYLSHSSKSKAKAVTLSFETEENYGRTSFWFLKANGEENEYVRTSLNRLLYLCKLKPEKLKMETKTIKNSEGQEVERVHFPELEDKKIGIILTVTQDGEQVNFDVKDFFDIKTKKTSDEHFDKKEATTVESFRKKYANKLEIPKKETVAVAEEEEDEFPF